MIKFLIGRVSLKVKIWQPYDEKKSVIGFRPIYFTFASKREGRGRERERERVGGGGGGQCI